MPVGTSRGSALLVAIATSLGVSEARAWKPPPTEQPVPLRLDESPALPLLAPFRRAVGVSSSSLRRYLDGHYGQWVTRPWRSLRFGAGVGAVLPSAAEGLEPFGEWGSVRAASAFPSNAWADDRGSLGDSPLGRWNDALGAMGARVAVLAARPGEGPRFANTVIGASPGERGPAVDAWLERAGMRPAGWPLVLAAGHWFVPAAATRFDETLAASSPPLDVSRAIVPDWLRRLEPDWAAMLLSTSGCGRGGGCSPDVAFPAQAFAPLWNAMAPKAWPIPTWKCRPRPVWIMRFGREADQFDLVRCDGSIAPEAIDRLAIIARPPDVDRPGDLLPDEPDDAARPGEWLPGIRVMSPRLLWLLQEVANAFPYRPIYIYSGYRPVPSPPPPETRASYHWLGRALDIHVQGVPNEELFRVCHELEDVGCGFYPNKPFVHVDVRPRGHGRVFWIDVSRSGERAQYVDGWPGVVEVGAMGWVAPLPTPW